MLLFLNLIVFGQNIRIKPCKRFIQNTDTFSVFSLADERKLVYCLRMAEMQRALLEIVKSQKLILEKISVKKDELIILDSLRLVNYEKIMANKDLVISNDSNILTSQRKQITSLKLERNFACLSTIAISLIALLILLNH